MGQFDQEDDEKQLAPGMDQAVKEYLLKKQQAAAGPMGPSVEHANIDAQYKRAAADTSAVDKAREDADGANKMATILQGVATMFAGPKKVDGSVFNNIRAANSAKAATAQDDHRQKLSDMLTGDKLQRQGVERAQADKQFGWEEGNKDPSKLTPGAQLVMAKRLGVDPQHLSGLSFDQAKQLQAAADKAKGEGRQLKAVETERGIEWYQFDPNSGAFSPTGQLTGYKLATDNTTGTRTSGADKSAPATDIVTDSGQTQRDLRTATEGQRSYVKGTASQQVKDEQAVQEADANISKVDDIGSKWLGLYDQASKEGPVGNTGPVAGKVAGKLADFGVDMGPATNKASAEMVREASNYIRDQSGLSSTDAEFQRLLSTMPTLGMDRNAFQSRMSAWKEDVNRVAEKKRQMAGAPSAAPKSPAAAPLAPEDEAKVDAYMKKYPGKSREQIIKAMGL